MYILLTLYKGIESQLGTFTIDILCETMDHIFFISHIKHVVVSFNLIH